jgi:MoaA/NifB/PqqE/SkfB family radical SAM enzyme
VKRTVLQPSTGKKVGAGVDSTHLHSTFLLEQELQAELNESRVVELTSHNSEARIVRRATRGVRRTKLDAIEGVEKFGSELKPKPVVRTEICRLEYRKIPVIDARASECGIHARLVAECPIPRWGETVCVDPIDSSGSLNVRCALLASRNKIWPQLKVL